MQVLVDAVRAEVLVLALADAHHALIGRADGQVEPCAHARRQPRDLVRLQRAERVLASRPRGAARSEARRDGIALLRARYGIQSAMTTSFKANHIEWTNDDDGTRIQKPYGDMTPLYHLRIGSIGAHAFARNISLTIERKDSRLKAMLSGDTNDKRAKTTTTMNNVALSAISTITEQKSSREHVYDLTVAETRNMTAVNGFAVCCRRCYDNRSPQMRCSTLGANGLRSRSALFAASIGCLL